jgi:hypothetical protein
MECRLAAIVAAHVVAYSLLMERDEAGTLAAVADRRNAILEPLFANATVASFGSWATAPCVLLPGLSIHLGTPCSRTRSASRFRCRSARLHWMPPFHFPCRFRALSRRLLSTGTHRTENAQYKGDNGWSFRVSPYVWLLDTSDPAEAPRARAARRRLRGWRIPLRRRTAWTDCRRQLSFLT